MVNVVSTTSTLAQRLAPEPSSHQLGGPVLVAYADPLDEDQASDPPLTMTHRQLARLLFIAAETGGRFEREHSPTDPVAWLFSSRQLFGGAAAVDACQGHKHFVRAIILHGLSLGMDADPDELDGLLAEGSELQFDCQDAAPPTRARKEAPVLSPA